MAAATRGDGEVDGGAPVIPGPVRFARFAYPPNVLGYCGPDDHRALLEQGAAGPAIGGDDGGGAVDGERVEGRAHDDGGLRALARGFEGAWPYLELIAAANGIADPLDDRVVEAYWIGNPLLERVPARLLGASMEDRFKGPAARGWEHLAAEVGCGARPHHQFHVFAVYPWVGLLRAGHTGPALGVLDRCRIRWGRVLTVTGGEAVVRFRPLTWDGRHLALGPAREETAVVADDGYGFVRGLGAGDWVALHWDWVCERLTPAGLRALRRITADQLELVNRRAPRSAPATVLS